MERGGIELLNASYFYFKTVIISIISYKPVGEMILPLKFDVGVIIFISDDKSNVFSLQ